jgi:hypothetical protein
MSSLCTTRGVSHYGLAIYIKRYLNTKEELGKFKYIPKKSSKKKPESFKIS